MHKHKLKCQRMEKCFSPKLKDMHNFSVQMKFLSCFHYYFLIECVHRIHTDVSVTLHLFNITIKIALSIIKLSSFGLEGTTNENFESMVR